MKGEVEVQPGERREWRAPLACVGVERVCHTPNLHDFSLPFPACLRPVVLARVLVLGPARRTSLLLSSLSSPHHGCSAARHPSLPAPCSQSVSISS